ncbi:MAG TPA: hypothetical protein EYP88_04745 [Anaerolineales bacterium]|nr:hypothetical protein [Anaerolineales bacterium]
MTETSEFPAPPRLIQAMVTGFDAITNHILLILFPLGLDMLIWFAPRLRIANLIHAFLAEIARLPTNETPELGEMIAVGQEAWLNFAEQVNLMTALRSYPVGVPSLFAAFPPAETPLGVPTIIEFSSSGSAILTFALLVLAGLIIGTLYYILVAQAALHDEIRWRQALSNWGWAAIQVILLAAIWLGIFFAVTLPSSCLISVAAIGGVSPGACVSLIYGGALLWIAFQLIFSAHGIFTEQISVLSSIRAGMRVVSAALPGSALFVVAAFLLSQGLNILWRIPPDDSWLTLIGLAGHAFTITGLLSASFIYYRDARLWVKQLKATRT